ncbi:MAG: coproporphyrinogen III oxidase [Aeriscardovia sp.]|nr:coproporphyrinogen III oxidase [Aeriscardovia sp.]
MTSTFKPGARKDTEGFRSTGTNTIPASTSGADTWRQICRQQDEHGRYIACNDQSRTQEPFEVYVHIPFCVRRCGYCDFNTYTAVDMGSGASRGNYVNLAIREMELLHRWQQRNGVEPKPASTVFFGGGTPTILPSRDLVRIVTAIDALWGIVPGAEITTEANPDTVTNDSIAELADGGFTRVSFGMQSAVPRVLRVLDRTHEQANVVMGVEAAHRHGLRSSIDLIYGTPGETPEEWERSVSAALNLGVDHVSCYALTVAPTTKMGRRIRAGILSAPDDDDEADKYEIADALLGEAGLHWYEISNWARSGQESQHNLGYWHNVDWAGVGPGAHSHYGRLRAWDIAHPREWAQALNAGVLPWAGDELITDAENVEEIVLLGLRLREGLSRKRLEAAIRHPLPPTALQEAKRLEGEGLVERLHTPKGETRIRPTLRGRLLNDIIVERLADSLAIQG